MFLKQGFNFDKERHIYTFNEEIVPSTSSMVSTFHEKFKREETAKKMRKTGKGVQNLLYQWDLAKEKGIDKGNHIHDAAEFLFSCFNEYYEESIHLINFYKFLKDEGFSIVATEQSIYSEKYTYAGTFDLLTEKDGKYHLFDYKTNNSLFKDYGKNMLYPFEEYEDTKRNHYMIQQNHYALCLQEYGLNISSMNLVWITKDNYQIIKLPNLTLILKEYYDYK